MFEVEEALHESNLDSKRDFRKQNQTSMKKLNLSPYLYIEGLFVFVFFLTSFKRGHSIGYRDTICTVKGIFIFFMRMSILFIIDIQIVVIFHLLGGFIKAIKAFTVKVNNQCVINKYFITDN